ncbi:P-loop containing nucleoside triphosphate hydrolase protein [Dichotomopilus funicola]|uniref:P-loop containing nucleoside triphosphate hydrolase protein n=1 Tax=Dichotomopilus funicola TaxID=1934379 RepID=A0AAN6UYH4_9PEZI|nr:P-loop containing nucleoside triphosphate hydrolase protein [Dichotomopilus funicola]
MPGLTPKNTNLFQVFLRLRPPPGGAANAGERFLTVEPAEDDDTTPKHITLNPPNDRRRAVEKFAFTQVFEEEATQLDVFHCTGVADLVKGVLAPTGGDGTDALLATLGVTGSGKSHTILGSRSQRGLTQLALDVIFRSLGDNLVDCDANPALEPSIIASDSSEAAIFSAPAFLDTVFTDPSTSFRASSRAQTPMIVGSSRSSPPQTFSPQEQGQNGPSGPDCAWREKSLRIVSREDSVAPSSPLTPVISSKICDAVLSSRSIHFHNTPRGFWHRQPQQAHGGPGGKQAPKHFMAPTESIRLKKGTKTASQPQGESGNRPQTPSRKLHRPSTFPQQPDIGALSVSCDPSAEYAVVISMYEVYNDRIFDLLTPAVKSAATKEFRRRPLLFKPTEGSPDRKVVAGLRKVICGNLQQALMVLEAGLHERRVTGTGSNSVSSRSHGFFSVEVKKRLKSNRKYGANGPWNGSALTVVDLAGSERARDAKTAGATLAEAGKINESLMYLGQCLQMQSDASHKDKCKLTELLFSNSYPSASAHASGRHRNPQKAVMIVTADPHGDYNATSQILRYGALAREVTVPRVPSITQTILAATAQAPPASSYTSPTSPTLTRPFSPPGSVKYPKLHSPPNIMRNISPVSSNSGSTSDLHRSTMEAAALEIARLSEEAEYLRQALDSERAARQEAESHLLSMEDRMIELEQVIREDCTNEFEQRLDIEMARWRATMQVEMERGEEHWGRKIEVFERSLGMQMNGDEDEEDEDKENMLVEDIHQENERLRWENDALRREISGFSPTKRMPLQERGGEAGLSARTRPATAETGSPRTPRMTRSGAGSRGVAPPARGSRTTTGDDEHSLLSRMEMLRVSDAPTMTTTTTTTKTTRTTTARAATARTSATATASTRKVRRLPAKKWNAVNDDDDMF